MLQRLLFTAIVLFSVPTFANDLSLSPFNFEVVALQHGKLKIRNITVQPGFPAFEDAHGKVKYAESVRVFYSDKSFDDVTDKSPMFLSYIKSDNQGNMYLQRSSFGYVAAGVKYFFKVGLYDVDKNLIYITPVEFIDEINHSIVGLP